MRRSHPFVRRCALVAAVLGLVASGAVARATAEPEPAASTVHSVSIADPASTVHPASAADPAPMLRPGGLLPNAVANPAGDCQITGVVCKPSEPSSCTGYSSQTTPPATIKVLVHTSSTKATIQTVPFQTYVENVLPDEWISSWDEDSLRAGAVAVKSYAWYWVTHFGGYVTTPTNCFDVTDDTDFQTYQAGSATTRTTEAVLATWPVAVRTAGRIDQASYRAYLHDAAESCGEDANGSELSQWGSQNCVEESTGNKYNVILGAYYSGVELATAQQLRTAHDFEFVQTSTRVAFDAGHWSLDDGYSTTFSYGLPGDRPVITTNGDGFAHIGVFRPSDATWYLGSPTGHTATRVPFGAKSDIPVQAQYAGVHQPTVLAVFRPSIGTWYQATSTGGIAVREQFGVSGDIPVPGHYSGTAANDYADGIAVFRPSNGDWYVAGQRPVHFGTRGDIPMPADYDGNGTTDLAVYRPSNNRFYLRGQPGVHYGQRGDIPVTGDFTGDGKADLAVYRPVTHGWYVLGASTVDFGAAGDTPIGAAPYHD